MNLTDENIREINSDCPQDQGVFNEPWGIPVKIKGPVIYMRWEVGGVSGGSCWDSSNPTPYTNDAPTPKFKVLDLVLKKIKPDLTFLQFREIEELIHTNKDSENEYYGNCTDFKVQYIILSELIRLLESF